MVEFFETYLMPVLTFVGGGGAVYLINWRSIKKQAEAEATIKIQDIYQGMIEDLKSDREYIKKDNQELRLLVSELQKSVFQNSRDIEGLKHINSELARHKCVIVDCSLRKRE